MKYRVSTYTPRTAPGTARQKRRRGRRRGTPPIFRLALLAAMPVLVLLILHISRPAYMDQAAAISLAYQKKAVYSGIQFGKERLRGGCGGRQAAYCR